MPSIDNFSTEALPTAQCLSGWVEGAQAIGGIEAEPISTRPFHGTARVRAMGAALAWETSTGPHRLAWTRRLIERANEPHVRLWFQRHGQVRVRVRETEILLLPGEWLTLDSRYPYAMEVEDHCSVVAFQFPLSRLAGINSQAGISGHRIRRSNDGVAQMTRQCLEIALHEMTGLNPSPPFEEDLGETLVDLARLALREGERIATDGDQREAVLERIRQIVRRNIQHPDLSVEMVAKAAGCSVRHVHKLFNAEETIGAYIRRQRLERCRAELLAPANQQRSLTEIAFDNGFNSSSQFSRAFRLEYGTSPRSYRQTMIG